MSRTPISKLFDATERFKLGRVKGGTPESEAFPGALANMIAIYDHMGRVVACVHEDSLFDEHGNHFQMDE